MHDFFTNLFQGKPMMLVLSVCFLSMFSFSTAQPVVSHHLSQINPMDESLDLEGQPITDSDGDVSFEKSLELGGNSISGLNGMTMSGELGIGTESPVATLDVMGDAIIGSDNIDNTLDGEGEFQMNSELAGAGYVATPWVYTRFIEADQRGSAATGIAMGNHNNFTSDDQISFITEGSERMFIGETGNVGIGTKTPSSLLEVEGGTDRVSLPGNNENIMLSFPTTSGGSRAAITAVNEGAYGDKGIGFYTGDGSSWSGDAANERVRIDKSGNVGIGTTSPGSKLEVDGNADIRGNLDMNGNPITGIGSGGETLFKESGSFTWTGQYTADTWETMHIGNLAGDGHYFIWMENIEPHDYGGTGWDMECSGIMAFDGDTNDAGAEEVDSWHCSAHAYNGERYDFRFKARSGHVDPALQLKSTQTLTSDMAITFHWVKIV